MLARDKKKLTKIEYEKPINDNHLVFEEYISVPTKPMTSTIPLDKKPLKP